MRIPGSAGAILIVSTVLLIFLYFMNAKGIEDTMDNSIPMGTFINATDWLSPRLNLLDTVLVPHPTVFYSLDPEHKEQFRDYKIIWDKMNVTWQANTTDYEVAKVRQYLEFLIRQEPHIKYLVIDWFYPYANRIFTTQSCSDLGDLIYEVKRFDFQTPHVDWKNKMTICGIAGRT